MPGTASFTPLATPGWRAARAALLSAATLTLSLLAVAAPPMYRIVPMAVSSTTFNSQAWAINQHGDVSGLTQERNNPATFAVIWPVNGNPAVKLVDLTPGNTSDFAIATAINDAGTAAGYANDAAGNYAAVVWPNGNPAVALGAIDRSQDMFVYGINNSGIVVGEIQTSIRRSDHAVTWAADGSAHTIGRRAGIAKAINDAGQVVGQMLSPDGNRAFMSTPDGKVHYLAALPGQSVQAEAFAINALGQIVGNTSAQINGSPAQVAVLWNTPNEVVDMGRLPGPWVEYEARSINGLGQAVGDFFSAGASSSSAFYWTTADGMIDLRDLIDPADPLRPYLASGFNAAAINDAGVIVGTMPPIRSGDYAQAMMLVPITTPTTKP